MIEVLIALAILSMTIVSLMLLAGAAVKRTGRAAERWEHTHLLTQAVEFFMLNEAGAEIDRRFFPLEDYRTECAFEEPAGLSGNVDYEYGGQRLTAMKVVLLDKNGKTLDSVIVERIIGELEK
ncbi:MAG: hypothetical protein PHV82_06150 [Victivallaceae bacterium]|nr:hypothetical protein [Victivallaceae bacterium]